MTGHSKHACQLTGSNGRVCYLVKGHPGRAHVDITNGGLVVWSLPDGEGFRNVPLNDGDPARDAPERLRGYDKASGAYLVGSPAHLARERQIQDEQAKRDAFRDVEPQPSCGAARPHSPGRVSRCTERLGHHGDHYDVLMDHGWTR